MADKDEDTKGNDVTDKDDEDTGLSDEDAKNVLDRARGKDGSTDKTDEGTDKGSEKVTDEEESKWKALSRKHEKENARLAAELKKFEDANKSETQRREEQHAADKALADKSTAQLKRLTIAAQSAPENATPADLLKIAKRMAGDSDEDLEEDAKELWSMFGPAKGAKKEIVSGKPHEKLRGGGRSSEDDDDVTDPRELAKMINRDRNLIR